MKTKSFAEHYSELKEEEEPIQGKIVGKKDIISEDSSIQTEIFKQTIKHDLEIQLTEQIENRIQQEYQARREDDVKQIREELTEQLIGKFSTMMLEHAKSVESNMTVFSESINSFNDVVLKLGNKISQLSEGLKIEIPAPIVNVTMPSKKVERVVHRDEKGHILKITEEDQE
jgi:hypothetical protein